MLQALAGAWKQIWCFSLPLGQEDGEETFSPLRMIRMLPLAGLILGVALWLASMLVHALVNHEFAAAAVLALVIPAIFHVLTGVRSLLALSGVCRDLAGQRENLPADILGLLSLQCILLLQVFAVTVLALTGQLWWLALMPMLGAASYAQLVTARLRDGGSADGLGPVHWYIAGGVTVLVTGFLGQLVAGLFAFLIAALLAPVLDRFLSERSNADAETQARAAFLVIEVLILWVGVLAA